jgi:hypothetical protein
MQVEKARFRRAPLARMNKIMIKKYILNTKHLWYLIIIQKLYLEK